MNARRSARSLAIAIAIPPSLGTIVGFLGSASWVFDLFAHFRVQYLAALLVATIIAALARSRGGSIAIGALAVLNALVILPLWVGRGEGERVLRVAHVNVFTANRRHEDVKRWISSSDADAVFALEVNDRWARALVTTTGYHVALSAPRQGNFGMMLLVLGSSSDAALAEGIDLPAIEVTIGGVRVLGLHTVPPVSTDYSARRDAMLDAAAEWAKSQRAPAVVVGDYNATPWSAAFRKFIRTSGLRDSARGFGVQPSWNMSRSPVAMLLRIPIDHCAHSPDLVTIDRRLGPPNGSDHRPLIVDLARRGSMAR